MRGVMPSEDWLATPTEGPAARPEDNVVSWCSSAAGALEVNVR